MVLRLLGCCLRVLSLGIEKWGVDRWIHDRDWDGEECVCSYFFGGLCMLSVETWRKRGVSLMGYNFLV
jgi:hypothetical protein